jgi:transcriptional regulator with XRE-family HTH domain
VAQGPTTARLRLGADLRRLREHAGLTLEQASMSLECSTSKISRLETGKGLPRQRDIRDLLRLYGKDAERSLDRLLMLARQGAKAGWWQEYTSLLPTEPFVFDGTDRYVALESEADWLESYDVQAVHGLVQSAEYADRVLRGALPHHSDAERRSLLEFRMRRQEVLTRSDAPLRLSLIIDEFAFRRHLGDVGIMIRESSHLCDLGQRSNISLRLLPFVSGFSRATAGGQFAVLGFDDWDDQDVVFIEGAANSFLADDFGVETFKQMFADLGEQALGELETLSWLERYATELAR